jgi:hypothetical protein
MNRLTIIDALNVMHVVGGWGTRIQCMGGI